MYAYIDETGNTGTNLFDPVQTNFLNAAMLCKFDFDSVFRDRVRKIAQNAGVNYLHGNVLGTEGIESIAGSIIELIEFSEVCFCFAIAKKQDIAYMKFFDAIFDPGENQAASFHTYNISSLRFLLLLKFVHIVEEEDATHFWEAMMSRPSPEAERKAVSAIENTIQRIHKLSDARSKQLIGDTLLWAKCNIAEFSIWTKRKQIRYGHLPNIFTFPALLAHMDDIGTRLGCRIDKITHDQQSQFGQTLLDWHALFEGFDEPKRIFHFGDTRINFADIRDSTFEMVDSRESPGLQIIDIVAWSFARALSEKPIGQKTTEMLDVCLVPDYIYEMSLGKIERELKLTFQLLENLPLSEEQVIEGTQFLENAERLRQARIHNRSEN